MNRQSVVITSVIFFLGIGYVSDASADTVVGGITCACVDRTTCEGVYCIDPPNNYCTDSGTSIVHSYRGYCFVIDGRSQCEYGQREYDCESGCDDGECGCDDDGCNYTTLDESVVGGISCSCSGNSTCEGVTCQLPPEDYCLSSSYLRQHSPRGYCNVVDGQSECHYDTKTTLCDTPPEAECVDDQTLRRYSAAGQCEDAECVYSSQDEVCEFGCEDGACVTTVVGGISCACLDRTSCAGVYCNDPPENYCTDSGTSIVHSYRGYCSMSDGRSQCEYGQREYVCESGCDDGECECDDDGCEYTTLDESVVGGISCSCSGNSTCEGVTCQLPPEDYCIDSSTVMQYSPRGYCHIVDSQSECHYSIRSVECNTPPEAECVDDQTLRRYSASGQCDNAECVYDGEEDEVCEFGCVEGACLGPELCVDHYCDMVAVEKILINASGDILVVTSSDETYLSCSLYNGEYIRLSGEQSNSRFVYSGLENAMIEGQLVDIKMDEGSSICEIEFVAIHSAY